MQDMFQTFTRFHSALHAPLFSRTAASTHMQAAAATLMLATKLCRCLHLHVVSDSMSCCCGLAGLPWPNPQCPVVMVECENGREERSAYGNSSTGSSFFNEEEAKLTIRSSPATLANAAMHTGIFLSPCHATAPLSLC